MYDYHSHTFYSDDSRAPMKDMVEAACHAGLKELAITDHYDPDYPDQNFPFELDIPDYFAALDKTKKDYEKKIKIIRGIEIGIQHGSTLEKCSKAANAYDFDFVLGSFHCAHGFDLYGTDYFSGRTPEKAYTDFYSYMYDCLKTYKDYDVLAHFNIIDRYAKDRPANDVYMDIVCEILKMIIADGKGIEFNTSSFRYGLGERTTPAAEILSLYKELGGEIITAGSDAHKPAHIADNLDLAYEGIKKAGFRYITTFDRRKPSFMPL